MLLKSCLIFFLMSTFSFAQTTLDIAAENKNIGYVDSVSIITTNSIQPGRLIAATSGIVLANYAVYQPFKQLWWQEERGRFHFYRGYRRTVGYWDFGWNDSYCGHIDKLGHFYCSNLMAELLTDVSRWVGFNNHSSLWIGSFTSFVLMLEIEIYDSFFEDWGFSLGDLTANTLGAFSPMIRERVPLFDRFKLKFSYLPSSHYSNQQSFIKDYTGMTFWLSYNIDRDLPQNLAKFWPDFLNIAVGYGVDQPAHGNIELFLSPDINWMNIYQGRNGTLKYLLKKLDQFHFPVVTWQLKPRRKFYWLYF